MKTFMYSIAMAAALLLFAIWAAPPPASAAPEPSKGTDSMSIEKTDTLGMADIDTAACADMSNTGNLHCLDQPDPGVFRGACPIGALSQPMKGGECTSEHLINDAVYYDEDQTMSAPGFARHDLVLRC